MSDYFDTANLIDPNIELSDLSFYFQKHLRKIFGNILKLFDINIINLHLIENNSSHIILGSCPAYVYHIKDYLASSLNEMTLIDNVYPDYEILSQDIILTSKAKFGINSSIFVLEKYDKLKLIYELATKAQCAHMMDNFLGNEENVLALGRYSFNEAVKILNKQLFKINKLTLWSRS